VSDRLALLRPAVRYALDAVDTVTPGLLSRPTPCAKWNLGMLLCHTSASAAALQEGLDCGRVALFPADADDGSADPADRARVRIRQLLEEWTAADDGGLVAIADQRIPTALMGDLAALEIAVHGWDVYQASGRSRPIPTELAIDLLAVARELLPDDNRHHLFAAPLPSSETDGPAERLLAFLGRPAADAPSITTEAS
jgi:uncharacterized protein (TIGR03086 family)